MTQNSSLDRDFPSRVLFPARSSPLVCAADALDVLLRLLGFIFAGASAPDAARRVVRGRTLRPPSPPVRSSADDRVAVGNNGELEAESLTLGNQYPLAHTVMFVLGVLPQAIKLFGMRGIPWTQAWGGLYLSSFLVLAGVGTLARFARGDTPFRTGGAALGKRMMWMSMCGVMVQVGVWVWCGWALLHPVWGSFIRSKFYLILLLPAGLVMCFGVIAVQAAALLFPFFVARNAPMTFGNIACRVVVSLAMWCSYGVVYFFFFLKLDNLDFISISLLLLTAAGYVTKVVSRYLRTFPIIVFAVANLVSSVLYYRFRYDPSGSVKPLWTEKLG